MIIPRTARTASFNGKPKATALGEHAPSKSRRLRLAVKRVNVSFRAGRSVTTTCYASLYALSSAATSSFTIFIMAAITACTFLGFLSRMSSMKRLGTICQVMPN